MLAPPGLPEDIRAKLEDAVKQATETKEVQDTLAKLSLPLLFKTGADAQQETTEMFNKYGEIIEGLMKNAK